MKNYKEFNKIAIGVSDICSLVFRGANRTEEIHFTEDGSYKAYFCTGEDVEIGGHYSLVVSFTGWLWIYDDDGKSFDNREYKHYDIYRSGDFGTIIHAY